MKPKTQTLPKSKNVRKRRPAPAGYDALVQIIQDLRSAIVEHHSYDVMKEEHGLCPVCHRKEIDDLLNRASVAVARHNGHSSSTA